MWIIDVDDQLPPGHFKQVVDEPSLLLRAALAISNLVLHFLKGEKYIFCYTNSKPSVAVKQFK